jgi:TfoX/Sxy family transcriptional regulator of competence genes
MFGEYAVYLRGKVLGLICAKRLFLKPTPAARALWPEVPMGLPHPGAKPHISAEGLVDAPDRLAALLLAIAEDLPDPAPKHLRKARQA